jgi:hypothetical protein
MRLNGAVTFLSKYGIFTGNVEFVDYKNAKYKSDIDGDFNGDNLDIAASYKKVLNYNLGAEVRYDSYRLRAGTSLMSDPFVNDENIDRKIMSYSGGVGYRQDDFFIDLGVVFSSTNGKRIPYTSFIGEMDPYALTKYNSTRVLLTVGFTF